MRRSTVGPSTVVSPSSSIPSSAKNALAASRSSTTMRTLSIRNNLLFAVIFRLYAQIFIFSDLWMPLLRSSGRRILLRFGRPEHVPLSVDRVDQADGVAVVHLLTELPDAHGDRVRVALVIQPDPLQDILAREHSPLVERERFQQRVLARGE